MSERMRWADIAKGLSIVLVVYGHAVVGVDKDVPLDPWLFDTIMKPFSQFRMPLFFFVAGLFAARGVRRDWRTFIDRTLLHLVYVFIVWNVLQYGVRLTFSAYANDPIDPLRILLFPIRPINITWFIWALLFYYTVLRLCRDLPPALLVALAAVMFTAPFTGGHYALEQGSRFFVFFVLGYACADWMMGLRWSPSWALTLVGLIGYLVFSLGLVHLEMLDNALLEFINRCFGILAVMLLCMRLAATPAADALGWLGNYTLPIFVMHTLVTAALREVLLRLDLVGHPAVLIGLATLAGIVVPLAFHIVMQRLGLPWLFERPAWFRLPRKGAAAVRRPA